MEQPISCASASRDLNEALAGTVKPTDVFFLIETNATEYGGWGKAIIKSVARSGKFAPYLAHLQQVQNAKVLLIRRPQANEKNFYVAITHQAEPKIYHVMLNDYNELLNVDLSTVAPDTVPQINGAEMTEIDELYAVCTNGKHDVCCSTYGIPVYKALLQYADEDKVWQISHIGGHRFAATMIAFPHGIHYGYLDPHNAEEIVTNHKAGYLVNYKYRGRGSYGAYNHDEMTHKAISAVEYHIRETAKLYAINDLIFDTVDQLNESQWRVCFTDKNGQSHQATVDVRMSEPRQSSCDEAPKPMPIHTVSAYHHTINA